jgi:rRNA maturation RNase YbeY
MIKVLVKKTSNYPVNSPRIKRKVRNFLKKKGITSDAVISIAIIGKKRMIELSKKYMEDSSLHNVLSFTENEINEKFVYPPNGPIQLGEVVVCYAKAFEEAKSENKRIEEKVTELIEHGILHLLGVHHK